MIQNLYILDEIALMIKVLIWDVGQDIFTDMDNRGAIVHNVCKKCI